MATLVTRDSQSCVSAQSIDTQQTHGGGRPMRPSHDVHPSSSAGTVGALRFASLGSVLVLGLLHLQRRKTGLQITDGEIGFGSDDGRFS